MKKKKKVIFLKNVKFIIIILTFFLLGVYFSPNIRDFYNKKIVKNNINNRIDIFWSKDLDLEKFWKVYSIVKKNYYEEFWVNKSDLVDWAIAWMINALWDKHSEFMNSEETKKFNEVLSWDFEWIGAVVEKTGMWIKVDRLIKWSPAKKAWIKKDDIIIEANGENLVWLDLFDAVNKIKWPAWTKVKLKVMRHWENGILNIDVIRDKIKIPSVEIKTFTWAYKNIWYITLNMFWENTAEEFEKALNENKNKEWLIIDLRDNGWGYLQSAVQILSNFVENWETLVETKYKNSFKNNKYKSLNFENKPYNWKIVILLNQNSASASEITALALKKYKNAIIIWEKSYWKWSVQEPFTLDDGSLLKLTIAKWFIPGYKNIDWKWIKPDLKVDFMEKDYENLFDRQLDVAKKVVKDYIDLDSKQKVLEKWKNLYKQRWLTQSWTTLTWSLN